MTRTKIDRDLEFLYFIKALCQERMGKSALDDPSRAPIDFPEYVKAWMNISYKIDELEFTKKGEK